MKLKLALTCTAMLSFAVFSTPLCLAHDDPDDRLLCGPRCLLAVCEKLGTSTTLEEMEALSGYNYQQGTTMAGLKKAVESKGLRAVGMKIGLDELSAVKMPVIAHLWGSHFVVLESAGGDRFTVTDPPDRPEIMQTADLMGGYSGFALLVSRDSGAFPKPASRGPDLRLDFYTWDFGPVNEGAMPARTITLTNAGDSDLTILGVDSSCPCMTSVTSANSIPPGGKGEIRVVYDTRDQQLRQSRELYIRSNDPVSPAVIVGVSGYIRSRKLLASPREIRFGEIRRRTSEVREVYIRSTPEDEVEVISAACDSPHLKAKVSPSKRPGLPGYIVTVSVRPDAPLGRLTGKLVIRSTHAYEPRADITVSADVQGDLLVTPDSMFFGIVRTDRERKAAVRITSLGERSCRIEKAECSLPFVSIEVRTDGNDYVVRGTLRGRLPQGNMKGEVTLYTDDPERKQLKVPIYGLVER